MAIEELKGLECFNCKTRVFTKISNDTYKCKGCGHINYRSTDEDNIKYVNACTAMENYHFSDAYNIYHNLYLQANESKFKAQAIFGMLKATYGIIYIESNYKLPDEDCKKKIPTFSNYDKVTQSLLDTDLYKEIKELNFDEKDKFLNEIKELDKDFKKIRKELDSDTIYDVFICVKISSLIDWRSKTNDYTSYAVDIYDKLTKDGLKVFCSEKNKVTGDAEIFAALAKSKVMLVISESKEHLESSWVQSEWRRWLNFIEIGKKDDYSLIALFPTDFMVPPTFEGKNINNRFKDTKDVYKKIDEIVGRKSQNKVGNIEDMLLEGRKLLEIFEYDEANSVYLNIVKSYPNDYRGWSGLLDVLKGKNINVRDIKYQKWLGKIYQLVKEDTNITKVINLKYGKLVEYSINYNLNGGIGDNPSTYNINSEIIINQPYKKGYKFIGWKINNDEDIYEDITIFSGSSGTKSLEAVYSPNIYRITLNSLMDSINDQIIEVEYNSLVNLPKLEKEGYYFDGWFNDKDELSKFAFTFDKDIILNAKWQKIVNKNCYFCGNNKLVEEKNGTYKCLSCGNISFEECFWCKSTHLDIVSDNKYKCKSCGNINYKLTDNDKFIMASTYIARYNYEKADRIYQELSESTDIKTKIQALYGRLLAFFGVTYIKDFNGSLVVTNYRPEFSSITECSYYKDIINSQYKDEYINKLNELDTEYKRIKLELDKGNKYDIFICTKISLKTKENPNIEGYTQDSKYANILYDELTKKGLKVFYSDKVLSGIDYDAQIYSALMRSEKMLIISSDREYLESAWVQSEWERWINFIKEDVKGKDSLYLFVPNNTPIELPLKLEKTQKFTDTLELVNRLTKNNVNETQIKAETKNKPKERLEKEISKMKEREKVNIEKAVEKERDRIKSILKSGEKSFENESSENKNLESKEDSLHKIKLLFLKTKTLGKYPQTKITDNALINTLKTINYANELGYIEYNGEEYKGYEGNFYLVEPIKWKILESNNNTYRLVSDVILDQSEFYEDYKERKINKNKIYSNNYEYSNIRAWLNGYNGSSYNVDKYIGNGFIDITFTEEERKLINVTNVDNSASTTESTTNKYACNNALDKVYLLSYQDIAKKYFTSDEERKAKVTDYAKARGVRELYGYGDFWLRSPSDYFFGNAFYVSFYGGISSYDVNHSNFGARPALEITIK